VVRRYDEPIEVRETRDDVTPALDAFVWRGRLYVVRAVLDRWKERRPWWRDVHDQYDQRDQQGRHQSSRGAQPGPAGTDVLTDAREQLVWRVEASAGRLAAVGVFDLGLTPERQWTLLRVAD